jgi:hypothetical protein
MIFQTMAYKERTIYVDQYACDKGPFHSLLKTCKKLREEISEWVSKRSDIVDSPVFGFSCPSVTTFKVAFSENVRTTFGEVRTYNAPQSRRQLFRVGCWKYLMHRIKSTNRWEVTRELYRLFEDSPEFPVRFLSGVLGVPVEEITSDVIHHQRTVFNPNYDKYIAFRGPNYEDWGSPEDEGHDDEESEDDI